MTQVVAFSFVFLISRLFSCLPDGSQEVMLQGSQGSLNSWKGAPPPTSIAASVGRLSSVLKGERCSL